MSMKALNGADIFPYNAVLFGDAVLLSHVVGVQWVVNFVVSKANSYFDPIVTSVPP